MQLSTIGYEGKDIQYFVALLKREGVTAIIDVREKPFSRKKGFSKNKLQEALSDAGIKYYHFKKLGSPSWLRKEIKESKDLDYFQEYRKLLDKHLVFVDEIIELLKDEHCCLMCYEADVEGCHRKVVAEKIVEMGDGVGVMNL